MDCLNSETSPTDDAENQTHIPRFLSTLYDMVAKTDNNDYILWFESTCTICIKDRKKFISRILPQYFKHRNFQSFLRQLNMYGFNKVNLNVANNDESLEFQHPKFRLGKKFLLPEIKRKSSVAHYQATLDNMMEQHANEAEVYLTSIQKKVSTITDRQQFIDKNLDLVHNQYKSLVVESKFLTTFLDENHKQRLREIAGSYGFHLEDLLQPLDGISNGTSVPPESSDLTSLHTLPQLSTGSAEPTRAKDMCPSSS